MSQLEMENAALRKTAARLTADLERVTKERDEWRGHAEAHADLAIAMDLKERDSARAALRLCVEALNRTFEGRMSVEAKPTGAWVPPPWFTEAIAAAEVVLK